ncbi:TlpA family protein disulfide reductase [Effusibacillus lacus]|uniref:Alkyl hydroperoxide reductase n=1 Tax=Effusibacillus lacus TaxID=1348429 RepID=A0A292YED0_9BACL|nr:TlpA disulfide reductase family protein [Effusibacillus lacus]TCS76106.1 peroxiredoxin [Effusibacillus lacus]GAX91382.1 alkyl hydroperoxide reductase [Effusibacillus lacus]
MNRRFVTTLVLAVVVGLFVYAFLGFKGKTEAVKVGMPAYDFQREDLTGKQIKLSDYKGKVVVLNFFTTWCPPCIEEAPELQKFEDAYKDKAKLLIIDRQEPKERVQKFVQEKKSTSTYLLDIDDSLAKKYGVVGQPETFVIDRQGIIREHIKGPVTFDSLVQMVKKYE